MSYHPEISEISTGFDNFLSGILARPVTAGSVAREAQAMGADAISDRYVDVCLMAHSSNPAVSSLTIGSPVSAYA